MCSSGSLEFLCKFLSNVALSNSAHINILVAANLHEPLAVLLRHTDVAMIHSANRFLDRLITRHMIAAETDLPKVHQRSNHRLKCRMGHVCNSESFPSHLGDFGRDFHLLAGMLIDIVEGRILMHTHHVVKAHDLVLNDLRKTLRLFWCLPKDFDLDNRSHMEGRCV